MSSLENDKEGLFKKINDSKKGKEEEEAAASKSQEKEPGTDEASMTLVDVAALRNIEKGKDINIGKDSSQILEIM